MLNLMNLMGSASGISRRRPGVDLDEADVRYAMARPVAWAFMALSLLTVVGGFVVMLDGGLRIRHAGGDPAIFLSATAMSTVIVAAVFAFMGYLLHLALDMSSALWAIRDIDPD